MDGGVILHVMQLKKGENYVPPPDNVGNSIHPSGNEVNLAFQTSFICKKGGVSWMASSTIGTMSDEGYTISAAPISSATLRWHGGLTAHQACPVACKPVAQFQGRRRRKYGNERKEEKVNGQTQCEQYNISGGLDSESEAATEAVSDFWKEHAESVDVQGRGEAGTDGLSGTHGPEDEPCTMYDPILHDRHEEVTEQVHVGGQNIINDLIVSLNLRACTDAMTGQTLAAKRGFRNVRTIALNALWLHSHVQSKAFTIVKITNKFNPSDALTKSNEICNLANYKTCSAQT